MRGEGWEIMINSASKNEIQIELESALNAALKFHLTKLGSKHTLGSAYEYAVLPAGKLFRPKLVWNLALDLGEKIPQKNFEISPFTLLATAIEIHHAYTLVHDDLPCMDNDLERRGKPTVHVQYNDWVAVLTGDGLLNMSYQLLAKIQHPLALKLIALFSHATGPKGLIEGQVLDLNQDMTKSLENLIRTHELKTARLIQVSLVGAAILSNQSLKNVQSFWRFGKNLGILFQLLDDLAELTSEETTDHEKDVNPYLKYFARTFPILEKSLLVNQNFFNSHQLPHLQSMVDEYLNKMQKMIFSNEKNVRKHIGIELQSPEWQSLLSLQSKYF